MTGGNEETVMAKKKVNLNNADMETLQQLPGIGKSLAERIDAGRPFQRVEDLLEIQGVGKRRFERIKSNFEIAEVERLDADLELDRSEVLLSENGREAASIIEQIGSDLEAERPQIERLASSKAAPQVTLSRGQSLTLIFGVGIISIILSVITTLVIMVGINDTLNFNQLQSIQVLESNLVDLEGSIENIASGLDSLNQKVEPLEGLDSRVTDLDAQLGTIRSDVDQALLSLDSMQSELDFVQTETTRLSNQARRFNNFLDGLAELMRGISSPEIVE